MNCDGELFMNFSLWTNNASILWTFHELFIKSWTTFHRGYHHWHFTYRKSCCMYIVWSGGTVWDVYITAVTHTDHRHSGISLGDNKNIFTFVQLQQSLPSADPLTGGHLPWKKVVPLMRGHLSRDTFALAPRCPLIRGTTVCIKKHFTYCMFHFSFSHCLKLNGRWFPQIVDKDSGKFSHSLVLIFDPKGGGGGGCNFFYSDWMFHFSFSHCSSPSLTGYGKC